MSKRDPDAQAPALPAAHADFVEATSLAWSWHGQQTRKGKPTPYVSHLLQVQGLVLEHGGDRDQAIAALLHDALEDAKSPADRVTREGVIGERFGLRVLDIVLDCTDTTREEAGDSKGPWRTRKERYLAQLGRAGPESLLVAACDKHHNLSDLLADLREEGIETLARFNAGPLEQLWYFDSLAALCREAVPSRLGRALGLQVGELRGFVTPSQTTDE